MKTNMNKGQEQYPGIVRFALVGDRPSQTIVELRHRRRQLIINGLTTFVITLIIVMTCIGILKAEQKAQEFKIQLQEDKAYVSGQ